MSSSFPPSSIQNSRQNADLWLSSKKFKAPDPPAKEGGGQQHQRVLIQLLDGAEEQACTIVSEASLELSAESESDDAADQPCSSEQLPPKTAPSMPNRWNGNNKTVVEVNTPSTSRRNKEGNVEENGEMERRGIVEGAKQKVLTASPTPKSTPSPVPPPQPPPLPIQLKTAKSSIIREANSRDQLLEAIRNANGAEWLRQNKLKKN